MIPGVGTKGFAAFALASDFAWDTSETACADGTAGTIPITTGAPHARFLDVPVGFELS